MSVKWVTSDLHLFHEKIIEYCDRPYNNASDMNECIISTINEYVMPGDCLYILGDVSLGPLDGTIEFLKEINCQLFLIAGNHDKYLKKQEFRDCFVWVNKMKSVKMAPGTKAMVMCHFPMLSWNNMAHGSWHLHGHTHGSLSDRFLVPERIDVGWDLHYKPLDYNDLVGIVEDQEDFLIENEMSRDDIDHHGDGRVRDMR
jgi:calcineurin-like phosphoesterase family protein